MKTIARLREWVYQKKLVKPVELPAFVVSVGNLSVGGTGKSAFVMHLAEWAVARKIPTLVLSRGYKRKSKALKIIKPFESLPDAAEIGDEPWMIKHRVPGITMLVHHDRARMAARHWADFSETRLIILDDAFQHWQSARDLDVVMIDAKESLDQPTLPWGRLRETLQAARRADLFVITRAEAVDAESLESIKTKVQKAAFPRTQPVWKRKLNSEPMVVSGDYKFESLVDAVSGEEKDPGKGREFLLVSGIAKPDHLRAVVKKAGFSVVEEIYFPDHHRLSNGDVNQIRKSLKNLRNGALLITEKDWGRWRALFRQGIPGFVIRVNFSFSGNSDLDPFLSEVSKGAGCFTLR